MPTGSSKPFSSKNGGGIELMLRPVEVAERLNCALSTVYLLVASGALDHFRCPGIRVSETQLANYLERVKRQHGPARSEVARPARRRLRHISL